jgi:hypothetical protein
VCDSEVSWLRETAFVELEVAVYFKRDE